METMLKTVGFPAENIEKLTNTAVTKSNIIAKINAIRQKATRNDLFVMYYSGHGDFKPDQTQNRLCSISTPHNYRNNYDNTWTIHQEGALAIRVEFKNFNTESEYDVGFVSDPASYAEGYGFVYTGPLGTFWSDWVEGDTLIVGLMSDESNTNYGFDVTTCQVAITFDASIMNYDFESAGEFWGNELDAAIDALPCLNQYYFFDSCMSGGIIHDLAQRGRTIFTACKQEEYSWETNPLGHGVFTYYLLQSFNKNVGQYVHDLNGDGQVNVVEMFNWTEPNTITKSGQLGLVQHPQLYNNPNGCGIWNFTLLNVDSDGDRLCDWGETHYWGSDPLSNQSDNDGLLDGDEVELYGSSPARFDTDSDQLGDWEEAMIHHTNPASSDTDGDYLLDLEEIYAYGTSPTLADTDGDFLLDGAEILIYITNPFNFDSDTDGLWDGLEVNNYSTNPLAPDSDRDGFLDGIEISLGANPLDFFSPWNMILLVGVLLSVSALIIFKVIRYRRGAVARPRKPERSYVPYPEKSYHPSEDLRGEPVQFREDFRYDFTPSGVPIYHGLTEPQWVALGKRLITAGRVPDAEACFRIAYALSRVTRDVTKWRNTRSQFIQQNRPSPMPALTPIERAKHCFETGCLQYKRGLYQGAEKSFREALQNDPSLAEAWRFLGLVLQQRNESSEAEQALWNAVHYNPKNPYGWANLGDLLLNQGLGSEAEIAFRRALEVAPPGWGWRILAEERLKQARSMSQNSPNEREEQDSSIKAYESIPTREKPPKTTPEFEQKPMQGEGQSAPNMETGLPQDSKTCEPIAKMVTEEQIKKPPSLEDKKQDAIPPSEVSPKDLTRPLESAVDNQCDESHQSNPISSISPSKSVPHVKPPPETEIIEKCGFCGNIIKNQECISCGAKVCPSCKDMNFATATVCVNCGKDLV